MVGRTRGGKSYSAKRAAFSILHQYREAISAPFALARTLLILLTETKVTRSVLGDFTLRERERERKREKKSPA